MFGECHAHIIMDGVNYRHAVEVHKNGPVSYTHLDVYKRQAIRYGDMQKTDIRQKQRQMI